jgi:enamine deaminase RidA (YjgF/YER057c/UK114 family)
MTAPHQIVNPEQLARPVGFAHAVIPAAGKTIYLGGQGGMNPSGELVGEGLVEQFNAAAENIVTALRAAGAAPEHLVSMQIFVTDADEYRRSLAEIGEVYKNHFRQHYPALALFEISGLLHQKAKVELWCVAVVPQD